MTKDRRGSGGEDTRRRMELLTLQEAGKEARVSQTTLWRMRKDGLPSVRLRGRVLIDRADLEKFIEDRKVVAAPVDPDVLIADINGWFRDGD